MTPEQLAAQARVARQRAKEAAKNISDGIRQPVEGSLKPSTRHWPKKGG